ncbi:MAG: Threonylcarbamoyl-AMP synthase [Chlamydiia bacterium]|nr:Threonylcarbamoyl-AMP synthase [Chlamydiia bacterium]MCH9615354.1 Threonylcarbamoyl-AMP synthase [Chlamydiia bacterium]MCH9628324.1 Threonylcarbamoyl-AMP synthase [Chlamydiia bacterium]
MNLVDIHEAVNLIKAGEVIAIPTDTVYGLVCSMKSKKGVERIYALKGRPKSKHLITLLSYPPPLPEPLLTLAQKFWPGPLTLIVDGESVRIPNHPLALDLIEWGGPLWSTSANLSGEPPALCGEDVPFDIPILGGGPCPLKKPSTIYSEEGLLREGAISKQALQSVLQKQVEQIEPAE